MLTYHLVLKTWLPYRCTFFPIRKIQNLFYTISMHISVAVQTSVPSPAGRSYDAATASTSRGTPSKHFHLTYQFKMAPAESAKIQEAQKLAKTDPRKAEAQYKEIISKPPSATSDAAVREYETALVSLGELYRDEK